MLFPVAYAPSILYLKAMVRTENPLWDKDEHWIKQSIRNRCEISASEGKLSLVIPVKHSTEKQAIGEIEVDEKQPWRRNHWRTLKTCYQNAPYFEHYAYELNLLYQQDDPSLWAFNQRVFSLFVTAWKLPITLGTSEGFTPYIANDYRSKDWFEVTETLRPYYQVFQIGKPFLPNLSCFDLLFNEGPLGRNWILNEE